MATPLIAKELQQWPLPVTEWDPEAGAKFAPFLKPDAPRPSRAAYEEGFRLAFHTHDAELGVADDGSVLLERLVADAPQLELELDLGWAWIAGRDPGEVLASLGSRCRIVHVKDFADRGDRTSFTSVGEGAVPFDDALAGARDVEWLVAEQDEGFVPDELSAAARSAAAVLELRERLAARAA